MAAETDNDTDDTSPNLQELTRQAGGIAQNAHLVAINLRRLDVSLLSEPEADRRPASLLSEHRVRHEFKPASSLEEAPSLRIQADFQVRVRDGATGDDLFLMKATLEADYRLNRGMPVEAVDAVPAFAATNAMIHMWPYYRELVQSTTWRMGLPPFPLPLFRIVDTAAPRQASSEGPKQEKAKAPERKSKRQ